MAIIGDRPRVTGLAAAHAAGFGSYAQFYRVFREATGESPSTVATRSRVHGMAGTAASRDTTAS